MERLLFFVCCFCTNLLTCTLQGQPLRLSAIGGSRYNKFDLFIAGLLPSRLAIIKLLYFPRFGIFFLFEKENACKRKTKQGGNPPVPPATPRRST